MVADTDSERLGLAFHEAFSFSVPAVAQVLSVVSGLGQTEDADGITRGLLSAETTLGPNYVRAMPRYCYGSGLLDGNYGLTAFGEAVLRSDSSLSFPSTLWLLHYHLAALGGPGPSFWHYFVTRLLRPGEELSSAEVGVALREQAQEDGRSVTERTAKTTATVVLGSYSKPDALGPLGLVESLGGGRYMATAPKTPSPLWAFAYGLASHWQTNWGDVTGVNLTRLAEEGGVGPIFMMGGGLINRYLGDLQREGFAVVQRRTPPFQLTRNWDDPDVFLERIYG